MNASPNPRCKNPACRQRFQRSTPWEIACSPECIDAVAKLAMEAMRARRERAVKAARTKLRVELREGRKRLRNVSDWTELAQAEFNRFVRARDRLLPCVSCGSYDPPGIGLNGGAWDCGHFRSVGAAPELRFEEVNAARQCKVCNGGGNRKRGYVVPLERQMTVRANYRAELVLRIGLDKLLWLEGPHEPKRYRIDDLIAIRDLYRKKARELRV